MRVFGKVPNPEFVSIPGQNRDGAALWNWKGHSFPLHSYAQPYSLALDAEADIFRAEVRQGENAYFDARSPITRDRAEISWEAPFQWDTDLWMHGFLWVEPLTGVISGASQEPIVFQWHDSGDPTDPTGMAPVVVIGFTRFNTLRMQWAYDMSDPFTGNVTAGSVTLGPAVPGRWHNVLMRVRMRADATAGEVDCWLNGVLAEAVPGCGYTYRGNLGTPNKLGPYWKAGIYRFTDAVRMAIAWQGLTVSASPLLSRKDSVKPIQRL